MQRCVLRLNGHRGPAVGLLRPGLSRRSLGAGPDQLLVQTADVVLMRRRHSRRRAVALFDLTAVGALCCVERVGCRGGKLPGPGGRSAGLLQLRFQVFPSLVPAGPFRGQPVSSPRSLLGSRGGRLLGRQNLGGCLGPDPRRLHRLAGRVDRTQRRLVATEIVEHAGEPIERGDRARPRGRARGIRPSDAVEPRPGGRSSSTDGAGPRPPAAARRPRSPPGRRPRCPVRRESDRSRTNRSNSVRSTALPHRSNLTWRRCVPASRLLFRGSGRVVRTVPGHRRCWSTWKRSSRPAPRPGGPSTAPWWPTGARYRPGCTWPGCPVKATGP